MTHEELYKKNDDEQYYTSVVGELGSVRHAGTFTENNPFAQQFNNATNNQDRDALYAQAVEWQANYFNTLESREYNDPMNEVQRQRRAGINPDLAGALGLSSGSSISGSSSAIPSPQSDVEYSNAYGNTESVVSGINAACNVVNTIASFGTASINAIEQLKTMPSRVSLAESQAYITDQTKDLVVSQAKNSDIFQRLSLVKDLSGFFTPESTDSDYTNILTTLGYSSEQIPAYQQAIKNYHTNPLFQSTYQDGVKRANDLAAFNAVYTTDVQTDMYERTLAIQNLEQNISQLSGNIRNSFVEYLSSNGYGELVAKNQLASGNLTAKDIAFTTSKLEHDVKVFAQNLSDIKNETKRIDARIKAIVGKAKNEGRFVSPTEQFEIDALTNLRSQMITLGSTQLQNFYGMVNNANAIMYQDSVLLGDDGNPHIDAVSPRFMRTIELTYGNYIKSDEYDLSNILLGIIPKLSKNPGTTIVNNIKP